MLVHCEPGSGLEGSIQRFGIRIAVHGGVRRRSGPKKLERGGNDTTVASPTQRDAPIPIVKMIRTMRRARDVRGLAFAGNTLYTMFRKPEWI